MAHEIEKDDEMFSVKQVPWHGLGKVIKEAPSIEEGIKLANLDWEVKLKDLVIAESGEKVTHRAVVREDTGKTLGVVGPQWKPLQNKDAFQFFDSFIQDGTASLETAGSLRSGGKVWILAKINQSEADVIPGDQLKRYLLLSDDKAGNGSVRVGFTTIRVVCNNTLSYAHRLSDKAKKGDDTKNAQIRITHSGQTLKNLEAVKDLINVEQQQFYATLQMYRQLAKKQINQKDIERFVKVNFFSSYFNKDGLLLPDTELHTKTKNNLDKKLDIITELVETGVGSDIKDVRGSYWGLYNAGTEFLTHLDKKDSEQRLDSLWFGDNVNKNSKMLASVLEMVA